MIRTGLTEGLYAEDRGDGTGTSLVLKSSPDFAGGSAAPTGRILLRNVSGRGLSVLDDAGTATYLQESSGGAAVEHLEAFPLVLCDSEAHASGFDWAQFSTRFVPSSDIAVSSISVYVQTIDDENFAGWRFGIYSAGDPDSLLAQTVFSSDIPGSPGVYTLSVDGSAYGLQAGTAYMLSVSFNGGGTTFGLARRGSLLTTVAPHHFSRGVTTYADDPTTSMPSTVSGSPVPYAVWFSVSA